MTAVLFYRFIDDGTEFHFLIVEVVSEIVDFSFGDTSISGIINDLAADFLDFLW